MWFHSSYNSMKSLCDNLPEIKEERVYNSMISVDRADFSPYNPYVDTPQSIGSNVTISAPSMHAYCLDLLKDFLVPGAVGLDVGFGSGYLTVAMSKLMQDKGLVVGIEHIKDLCEFAKKNIGKHHQNLLDEGKILLIQGDGRNGYKEKGPYNGIHVGAAADKIPQALIDQLAKGGRLVIPVGPKNGDQYICVIDKDKNGNITQRKTLGVRYVPLTSVDKQLHDDF